MSASQPELSSSSVLPLHHISVGSNPESSGTDIPDQPEAAAVLNAEATIPPDRRVPLTAYRLLNISVIVSIGTAKAVLAAQGKSVAPTVLEWVLGVVLGTR